MQKLFRSLIALGGLAGLVACGDDVSVTEPPPAPLTISGAPVTAVSVGAKVQLSASEAATWASSAANVASVDGTGLVTAVAAGTASITATATADVNRKATVTITVVAPAVRSVTVSPTSAILKPGDTQGFVANVDADAGVARTVTWSSSNTAVATVNATGVVTAVTPGAATITATSTANTTVSGAAALTVRAPTPATISVQNITVTGTPGNTVNVNNIAGSIDVNLNVDPGEQIVSSVEVRIDGNVACTQNLSGAQSEAMRQAAALGDEEAVIVSCQINTASFNAATGVANFANGAHTLSARAILVGGTDTATPSSNLIFNNASGITAVVSNNNGSDPASAINPGTGFQWIGGAITIQFVGVSYVAGTTVASANCNLFGKNFNITFSAGTNTTQWTEGTTAWSSTNTQVARYLSPSGGESITCGSAVVSNGQPMAAPSGSVLLNYGSPANPLVGGNAAMPVLQVLRLDNTAPGAPPANGGVSQLAIAIAPMTLPWVNAASTLGPNTNSVNILGLPSFNTLNQVTAGTGNDTEEGADAVSVTINVPAAGGTLPATTASTACTGITIQSAVLTGLTAVTTGNQLAETTVSTAYPARIVFKDGLGNISCLDLVQSFGADFTPPTATITGPVANTGYNAALPNWATTASDNASGFSLTGPMRVIMTRLNPNNTVDCVIGSGTGCTTPGTQNMTFSATGGPATDGYYTTTISIQDAAGNSVTLITAQVNGFDATLPLFSGGISLPAVIAGATTNTFTTTVTDNLDLGSIFGVVAYPGFNLQYPSNTIGSFGSPLEQSSTNFGYAVANWIRCINAAGSFLVAANQPTGITLSVTDQTSVPSTNTTSLASGAFGANAAPCNTPAGQGHVGNIPSGAILSFLDVAPNYGAGKTDVDLDGQSVATTSATSVVLSAIADVALNSSADPFSRVDFYYQNGAGNWVKIGTGSAVLAQTQTNRTYTYSFTWDPAAPVAAGAVPVMAVGVDAQGDAVVTAGVSVTIVP
jgi:hypothetical protein